jgi:hypothetical protein
MMFLPTPVAGHAASLSSAGINTAGAGISIEGALIPRSV